MEMKYKCAGITLHPIGQRAKDGSFTPDPSGKEIVIAQFVCVDKDGKAIADLRPITKRYENGKYEVGGLYDALDAPIEKPAVVRPARANKK